jgi:hypothetical protein
MKDYLPEIADKSDSRGKTSLPKRQARHLV